MREYTTEVVHKIFDNAEGVHICIGPDRDVGSFLEIYTEDEKSEEYYGKLNFIMPQELAVKIGEALIEMAQKVTNE